MDGRGKRQTATDRIRVSLADSIVRGQIGPGSALDEAELAERFKVSRTPVREAIRQLEAIGFAEARPHRGAVVPYFTPEKLTEMFTVMAEMEALCSYYAAANRSGAASAMLLEAHAECRQAAGLGDIDVYYAANQRFHETVYAAAGNGFLAEMTISIRNRVAPFRQAQFRNFGRLTESVAEHDRVVQAILAHDPDAAAAAMREHMRLVRFSVGAVAPALNGGEALQATERRLA